MTNKNAKPHYKLPVAYAILVTIPTNTFTAINITYDIYSKGEAIAPAVIFNAVIIFIYWLAVFVLGVLNIMTSFKKHTKGNWEYCVNAMLILKYGLIFFYVLNFILFLAACLLALVVSRGTIIFAFHLWLFDFIILAVIVATSYIIMLPGSFYSIQALRFCLKQNTLTKKKAVFLGILQFIFIIDVLSSAYIALKCFSKGKKSFIFVSAVIILLVLAFAATIIFL